LPATKGAVMTYLDVSRITSWHAHVYFDAASRDCAWEFRDAVTSQFGRTRGDGPLHERPVGPHPRWSYQVSFAPAQFAEVVG
jgi:DOPA 4,5-dioxygenase